MSEGLTFGVYADTTPFFNGIAEAQAARDKLVKEWGETRREIIHGVREGFMMVNSLISSYRQVISLMGTTIDPVFDAMVAMLSATVSMMLSIATAYKATLVLSPLGAVVTAVAIGLSILSYSNLMRGQFEVLAALAKVESRMPQPVSGVAYGVSF